MYHYCYLLTFPNQMRYVGARSTHLLPELDTTYLGSGRGLPPDRHKLDVKKQILAVFESREDLINFERQYIEANNADKDPSWYNLRCKTYDRHGEKPWNIGLKHEYKPRPIFTERYGKGYRTPAQIQGSINAAKKIKGTKNPAKGRTGTKNSGFSPWYYITPSGEYVEVHGKTKAEMAEELGFTPRQIGHGFHHSNQHKVAKTMPRKGWVFGNLPRPASD